MTHHLQRLYRSASELNGFVASEAPAVKVLVGRSDMLRHGVRAACLYASFVLAFGWAALATTSVHAESWCIRASDTMEPICAFSSLSGCIDAAKVTGGTCETDALAARRNACNAERVNAAAKGKPARRCN